MAIAWSEDGWGGAWRGMDDGRFVAQVAPYDGWQVGPGGADGLDRVVRDGQEWAAFIRGEPLPGRWAMAAVDEAHSASTPRAATRS